MLIYLSTLAQFSGSFSISQFETDLLRLKVTVSVIPTKRNAAREKNGKGSLHSAFL